MVGSIAVQSAPLKPRVAVGLSERDASIAEQFPADNVSLFLRERHDQATMPNRVHWFIYAVEPVEDRMLGDSLELADCGGRESGAVLFSYQIYIEVERVSRHDVDCHAGPTQRSKAMIVFVCSPYRGKDAAETDENARRARAICRGMILAGHVPIAPHVYFTQFLDDSVEAERRDGILAAQGLMTICQVFVVWRPADERESVGMQGDISAARRLGLPVVDLLRFFQMNVQNDEARRALVLGGLFDGIEDLI